MEGMNVPLIIAAALVGFGIVDIVLAFKFFGNSELRWRRYQANELRRGRVAERTPAWETRSATIFKVLLALGGAQIACGLALGIIGSNSL